MKTIILYLFLGTLVIYTIYNLITHGLKHTVEKLLHVVQHIFHHTLHFDVIWNFALRAHKMVKEHGMGHTKTLEVASQFFIGFMSMASVIFFGVIPLVTWLGNAFILKYMPITYPMFGEDVNLPLCLLYVIGIGVALRILIYCIWEVLIFGRRGVPQGHTGMLLAGDVPIEFLDPESGDRQTYPRFKKAASVIYWPKRVAITIDLDTNLEPRILTADKTMAIYDILHKDDNGNVYDDHEKRFNNDPLHVVRTLITQNKIVIILRLENRLAFYNKIVSMEVAMQRLAEMAQTARLETLGKKTYAMALGNLEVVRDRIKDAMEMELISYGCFEVDNVLIPSIDFMKVAGKKIEVTFTESKAA